MLFNTYKHIRQGGYPFLDSCIFGGALEDFGMQDDHLSERDSHTVMDEDWNHYESLRIQIEVIEAESLKVVSK